MRVTRSVLQAAAASQRRALEAHPESAIEVDPDRREAPPSRWLRRRTEIERVDAGGIRALRCAPVGAEPSAEVLYLHGGSYVSPSVAPHWWLVRRLIERSGAAVTLPAYPLAPEHTLDDALPPLREGLARLRARGRRTIVAGDSAGGGLSLALAIDGRDSGGPAVDGLLLFCPWLDVAMTDPATRALEAKDLMLRADALAVAGRAWAGRRAVDDPLVSPLRDHLGGLPPMQIHQGGHDLFLPDARRLARDARAAGGAAELFEYPDGFHVFMAAGWTPEARLAMRRAGAFVRG